MQYSEEENICYKRLIKLFGKKEVKRQYTSYYYPFNCDFYIRCLDLYVECQFYGTHGPEPYNRRKRSHQRLVEVWKEKEKSDSWYSTSLRIWTKNDPLKRKTAKKNNLNYKEFFSIREFMQFFNEERFKRKNK